MPITEEAPIYKILNIYFTNWNFRIRTIVLSIFHRIPQAQEEIRNDQKRRQKPFQICWDILNQEFIPR